MLQKEIYDKYVNVSYVVSLMVKIPGIIATLMPRVA